MSEVVEQELEFRPVLLERRPMVVIVRSIGQTAPDEIELSLGTRR